jgi:hypothetical protein
MTSLRTPFAGVFAVAMLLFGTGAASQAASVETSCVGYARAVTDHLRPGAPKGSPEYRAVYFPTHDECMRRGGSAAMPGGLAAAPWYLARPAAPGANPYNPPPPASSSGLPRPPAPPAANPYNPTPPAANPNPPAPPPGSPNPPAAAGKTPAEIVAYGKQKVAQSLPGGMSFPAAVRAAIEGCGALALTQANAAGANGSAAWQKAASDAIARCIAAGGAINGQFTLSRDLDLALRMAKNKSAPFERAAGVPGNNACLPLNGDADYKSCVTDQGQWFICYRTACHLAQPGLFPAAGASPSVSLYYNCPGAQCRTISSPKATECRRDEDEGRTYCLNDAGQMCVQQSNGSCAPVADIVYVNGKPTVIPVPGQQISRGMIAFYLFRCPTCSFRTSMTQGAPLHRQRSSASISLLPIPTRRTRKGLMTASASSSSMAHPPLKCAIATSRPAWRALTDFQSPTS